jgi:hypothetical protein
MAALTPGQLAHRDQVMAAVNVSLNEYVDTARKYLAAGHARVDVIAAIFDGAAQASAAAGDAGHAHRLFAASVVRLAEQSTPDGAR